MLLFAFFFVRLGQAMPEEAALAVGDWVFRAGTGRESALIRHLSGSAWSHVGVVVAVVPEVRIVHATTDDDPARPNQVIASAYADFAALSLAGEVAVARPLFLDAQERLSLAQAVEARLGEAFVLVAKQDGDARMPRYCTTIVADALQALRPQLVLRWQAVDFPFFSGDYLFPQALADVAGLQWL
ncbi:MAG: hypothetical protein Q4D61_04290 [Cardiobacteriaceae bacterium]|nr:hypothetical protein [Cardiobacteriaceae bacterium]